MLSSCNRLQPDTRPATTCRRCRQHSRESINSAANQMNNRQSCKSLVTVGVVFAAIQLVALAASVQEAGASASDGRDDTSNNLIQSNSSATTTTNITPQLSTTITTAAPHYHNQHRQWIDNILVRIQSLNLNGERANPFEAADSESDTDSTASDNSTPTRQFETEDPLEATITTTTTISSSQVDSSLRSKHSDNELSPVASATSASDDDEPSNESGSSGSTEYAIDDMRQPDAANRMPHRQQQQQANAQISTTSRPMLTCEQAYTQCALRKVCAPALKAYNDDCQDLINNKTSTCSAKCLKAMIALRSSEEGDDLVQCDCQGHEFCLLSKQRSLTCRPQVEEAVDPKTIVSCSVASWICLADQLCSTALDYYHRNCQSLFSQRHCSARCNNSLAILYRQPKANKLITCQCDGSEEFPCVRYKTYTEKYCLNKQPTQLASVAGVVSPSLVDHTTKSNETNNDHQLATDSDGELDNEAPRDDEASDDFLSTSGQTNLMSPLDTNEDTSDSQTIGETSGGSDDFTEPDDDNGNGIRPTALSSSVENDWIPSMSGRYFANLQLQQQLQQHLQRRKQQQQPQTSVSRDNYRPNGGGRHRSHRPTSGDVNNNEFQHHRRSRHNRILASTSPTASGPKKINIFGGLNTIVAIVASMFILVVVVAFVFIRSSLSRGFIVL